MFLNKTLSRRAFDAKIALEAAVTQRRVDEGKKELDGKRSMIRHVSHEIRYGCWHHGMEMRLYPIEESTHIHSCLSYQSNPCYFVCLFVCLIDCLIVCLFVCLIDF